MNAFLIFTAQYSSVWSPDIGIEGDMEGTWLNAKIFSIKKHQDLLFQHSSVFFTKQIPRKSCRG